MNVTSTNTPEGWKPAKEEPYYPYFWEKLRCALRLHDYRISKIYRGTKECLFCGKRKVGLKHY